MLPSTGVRAIFQFKLEPALSLLTVVRTGFWAIDDVLSYEIALRRELTQLNLSDRPTSAIIDTRQSGPQAKDVAEALRAMVRGLGHLNADRTAIIVSSGVAKLQAMRVTDNDAKVFTSMVLARDWVTGGMPAKPQTRLAINAPISAKVEGNVVHISGAADVDITLTPAAALETAKRIGGAALEVLVKTANVPPLSDV